MTYQLTPPYEIYHDGHQIADAHGHLCTAENEEIAQAILLALKTDDHVRIKILADLGDPTSELHQIVMAAFSKAFDEKIGIAQSDANPGDAVKVALTTANERADDNAKSCREFCKALEAIVEQSREVHVRQIASYALTMPWMTE